MDTHDSMYRACRAVLGEKKWSSLSKTEAEAIARRSFSAALSRNPDSSIPGFLPELARLEEAALSVAEKKHYIPTDVEVTTINPSIQVIELSWSQLADFLDKEQKFSTIHPSQQAERLLLWYNPNEQRVIARPARDEDLLVLKIVVEGLAPEHVASQGNLPVGAVDQALDRAATSGLLVAPRTRLRRDPAVFAGNNGIPEQYLSTPSFTLQWHITQVCDLHCKHCYDRSSRSPLTLDEAKRILDDVRKFCISRNVAKAVSFTGGNPLLHPQFTEIYCAAAERGFALAILGNPAPKERIAELVGIQMPAFYQVSLEGLQEHNDAIRGAGHFDRVLRFLDVLRELNVSSMVMLTLTSGNINQVLPLAELLRGKAGTFHFNRLSMVGEGANLRLPDRRTYRQFLESYLEAAKKNPIMGIKDNLINIIKREQGADLFGGCTGYGCGAAFNFVTLLADGEVHACRKFPSFIGNIHTQDLATIYDSEQARRYRSGSAACRSCSIRPVCGGCLASVHSHGFDVFQDKDPFCFL